MERLALVCPLKGLGHGTVVIFDERQDLAFQLLHGSEIATFERVMKDSAMGGIAQKGSSRSLGFQNPRFTLYP
jgi:hypothetical protein